MTHPLMQHPLMQHPLMQPTPADYRWQQTLDYTADLFRSGLQRWDWSLIAKSVKYTVVGQAREHDKDIDFTCAVMGVEWVLANVPPLELISAARGVQR